MSKKILRPIRSEKDIPTQPVEPYFYQLQQWAIRTAQVIQKLHIVDRGTK